MLLLYFHSLSLPSSLYLSISLFSILSISPYLYFVYKEGCIVQLSMAVAVTESAVTNLEISWEMQFPEYQLRSE